MNLIELEEKIEKNRFEEAIDIIQEIANTKYEKATKLLIKHLKKTDNNILRNEIAIALADIGNDEAIEPLITMLSHPKTNGSRGTLLYALETFNYIQHVDLLVELLYEDNFEVNRHALMLIESISTKISEEVLQKCISKIKEKIDFLSESLDVLSRQQ